MRHIDINNDLQKLKNMKTIKKEKGSVLFEEQTGKTEQLNR